jgi:creatinine amidohydrolase/Fe(II)-dependent formamide hydrolase-like protein
LSGSPFLITASRLPLVFLDIGVADRPPAQHRVRPVPAPAVTVSCSHEHSGFAGTVSLSAPTLAAVVSDVAESLRAAGIDRLAIVNGHGGNYVLANVVQQANITGPRMTLFPSRTDWEAARTVAGWESTVSEDMHAGELEVSLLLHGYPELVDDGYRGADWQANSRPTSAGYGHARLHRDRRDRSPVARLG